MYEITFITEEVPNDPMVKKTIESLGGKIVSNSSLGRRKLAYPIRKEGVGIYTSYIFTLEDKAKISDLNKKLQGEKEIFRFLIIQHQPTPVRPPRPALTPKVIPQQEFAVSPEGIKPQGIKPLPAISGPEAKKPLPAKKPAIPKLKKAAAAVPSKEVEATKEDRLKALEEKLSELLKE